MADSLLIHSEDDLWGVLERMLSYRLEIPIELFDIVGWQPELLYFPDEPIGHSISPSIARAVSGFHANLSRAYAYLAYGRPTATLLHNDDIAALDIRILVVEGSDGLKISEKAIKELVFRLVSKMTGKQITIAVVALLLLYFSSTVAKEWIDEHFAAAKEAVASSERVKASEEETKRIALITEALQKNPGLKAVADLASESKEPLARAVAQVGNARISGTPITGEVAKIILSSPRQKGAGKRMDGIYEVIEIDNENPDGYTGRVKNTSTNEEFTVSISKTELTEDDIDALFKALRDRTTVNALINAWLVGDRITHASVMRANVPL